MQYEYLCKKINFEKIKLKKCNIRQNSPSICVRAQKRIGNTNKKENYTMFIYKLIRDIILDNEPNAKDEFEWLDKIFDPKF